MTNPNPITSVDYFLALYAASQIDASDAAESLADMIDRDIRQNYFNEGLEEKLKKHIPLEIMVGISTVNLYLLWHFKYSKLDQ